MLSFPYGLGHIVYNSHLNRRTHRAIFRFRDKI